MLPQELFFYHSFYSQSLWLLQYKERHKDAPPRLIGICCRQWVEGGVAGGPGGGIGRRWVGQRRIGGRRAGSNRSGRRKNGGRWAGWRWGLQTLS